MNKLAVLLLAGLLLDGSIVFDIGTVLTVYWCVALK